jgi:hypothetical protein
VFIGFDSRSSRFFQRLCLGFSKIFLGLMAGVWMDGFSLVIITILAFLFGLLTCLSWCSILLFERYLVAKIRTIFLFLTMGVSFNKCDLSGFFILLGLCLIS